MKKLNSFFGQAKMRQDNKMYMQFLIKQFHLHFLPEHSSFKHEVPIFLKTLHNTEFAQP